MRTADDWTHHAVRHRAAGTTWPAIILAIRIEVLEDAAKRACSSCRKDVKAVCREGIWQHRVVDDDTSEHWWCDCTADGTRAFIAELKQGGETE